MEFYLSSSSILSHDVKCCWFCFEDNTYFGTGFSKLDQHNVWYLPYAAAKSLMLELNVNDLKHMCLLECTVS